VGFEQFFRLTDVSPHRYDKAAMTKEQLIETIQRILSTDAQFSFLLKGTPKK
jgi:hypothetical protein